MERRAARPELEKWIREGMLELPVTIAGEEQLIFQVEQYPTGCMVQNMRLATEAMGLGAWVFCGFNPDVLMGAMPEITRGLGFHIEAPNPKAPISTGQIKIFGIEGVKEATYVPSPRYKNAEQLVKAWYDEKYGAGGALHRGEDNYLRKVGSPWNKETTEAIIAHPTTRPPEWVQEALIAYIDYCVKTFGQWPVTYNPMQAHFGAVIHNLDEEFYDRYYKEGYMKRQHSQSLEDLARLSITRVAGYRFYWLLRLVHIYAAIVLVGAVFFNTVVLMPALRRIPPAHSAVVAQKIGAGLMWLGGAAILLLGVTGFVRVWMLGDFPAMLSRRALKIASFRWTRADDRIVGGAVRDRHPVRHLVRNDPDQETSLFRRAA